MVTVAEIWRAAPGLEGRYEVSNLGRARNVSGRVRKLKLCKRGYHWLSVANGRGSAKNISVARLVCWAFKGPPPPGHETDHRNRVRNDDRAANLRWLTKARNLARRPVRRGLAHHSALLNSELVQMIRSGPQYRGRDAELARQIGVARETIRDVRLGKYWKEVQ